MIRTDQTVLNRSGFVPIAQPVRFHHSTRLCLVRVERVLRMWMSKTQLKIHSTTTHQLNQYLYHHPSAMNSWCNTCKTCKILWILLPLPTWPTHTLVDQHSPTHRIHHYLFSIHRQTKLNRSHHHQCHLQQRQVTTKSMLPRLLTGRPATKKRHPLLLRIRRRKRKTSRYHQF